VIYLTGVSNVRARALAKTHPLGLMAQPANGVKTQIPAYRWWAADNGCYAKGPAFDGEAWFKWLDRLPRERCLFAVAPDVVQDPEATLARSRPWIPRIRALGFPVAYAAQDGITEAPWDEIDVLFIGGSTKWKLSPAATAITARAHAHQKTVHMGRVNSLKRIQAAALMGCQSADGTFLAYRARGGGEGESQVAGWLDRLWAEPFLPFLLTPETTPGTTSSSLRDLTAPTRTL
jgi:hypothetical protein